MLLTNNDIELIEQYYRERAREDFLSYRKYISGFKLKTGWFVSEISAAIQQFYQDYKDKKRPILVIQAPPQHGKSVAVCDGICWMAGQDPSIRFIYASFSERLGIRANTYLQRTIERQTYKKIFPRVVINEKRLVTAIGLQKNKEMVEFGEGGSFRNTTVRGSITGETLDIGVIDDPIKGREEANSETIRDKTWNWFTDDFRTRFDEYGALLIILTRWHIDDPVGRLLEINPNVKLLSYKAIAACDEKNRQEGEALFPEHKSFEFLLERKSTMPKANWESLYQQNPIIPGGEFFKEEWWNYYKAYPIFRNRMIFADTAQKTKEQNDYTVFQCWGVSLSGQAYLIDQLRGKWEAPELLVSAKSFWNKHKKWTSDNSALTKFAIEDKISGTGLIQTLKRDGLPVLAIPRDKDKITRAYDVSPLIESGNVFLPESAPWLNDYLLELSQFPNAVHDDQVDPTMDALTDILGKTFYDWEKLL